jgi:hypothetical protein
MLVASAINNLTKAQQHNVLQYKIINERGPIRVWRYRAMGCHVDWWPHRRRAKLRNRGKVTRHRAVNVDHILDLLDNGYVGQD